MIVLARYELKEILPYIGQGKPRIDLETSEGVFSVKTNSPRLQCLRRSQACARCRRRGTIWQLELSIQKAPKTDINCFVENCPWCSIRRPPIPVGTATPHLNLYHVGKKGTLILMTQDHIMPKHAGGSNNLNNLQTMCRECNTFKGGMLPHEYEKVKLNHERTSNSRPVAA